MSPNVLIQPSYGSPQAKANYRATLLDEVDFTRGLLRQALTPAEFDALIALHPGGKARFLATTKAHNNKMDQMGRGDVVLFTGEKRVLAVGEMSVWFRNPAAGDAMWPPHKTNGSYLNVYALLHFEPTDIPYTDLRRHTDKPGSKGGDNFMGTRLLRGVDAERVIDGLLIQTATEQQQLAHDAADWSLGEVIAAEAHNTATSKQSPARPGIVAERKESALVMAYKDHLNASGDDRHQKRFKSVVGYCDIYLLPTTPDGVVELVEAKSEATHSKVREAFAQLLDYVPHAPEEVGALTALFPTAPVKRDIEWLARYGIGCVYRNSTGEFVHNHPRATTITAAKAFWCPQPAT